RYARRERVAARRVSLVRRVYASDLRAVTSWMTGAATPRRPRRSARVLQAGRDAVDRQLDELEQPRMGLVVRRRGAEAAKQPDLELRERIHVGIAECDGTLD